jgi:hypothetical protein
MTNALLQIKFKERLNKLASMDYDNIECWQIQEAFNKAQLEWVRRSLRGLNNRKESSEQTVVMIDDLQVLLKSDPFTNLVKRPLYYESELVPLDYFSFIRASVYGVDDCCPERLFTVYLGEEANVNALLGDSYKSPNFEWGETFCTIAGNIQPSARSGKLSCGRNGRKRDSEGRHNMQGGIVNGLKSSKATSDKALQ